MFIIYSVVDCSAITAILFFKVPSNKRFQMYIIDGYNLLWSVHKVAIHSEEMTEARLCRLIGRYLRIIADDGKIVFDGIGPPDKTAFSNTAGVEVIFTGTGTDADSFIEAKISSDSAPKRLIVVSSDRRIRNAAKIRKATSVKSEQFWHDVLNVLRKKDKVQEPVEKRQGLDQAQTGQWLKYFGFDQ
jgi:predicted RNA-binding protein with PIN domain